MSNLIPVYGNLLYGGSGTSVPALPTGSGLKLLCDTILTPDKFLSATEQAGPYVGPAIPGTANKGSFGPVTSGDIADFVYDGTATSNGAAGGTTTIDSVLTMFGDDYFIGATLLMTGGTCSGQSKVITDFAQATGTLTHGAFTAQIDSGDTFTLTLAFATRDIHIEEVASGDTGTATFKWSHTGGAVADGGDGTWLGRNNPNQANWLARTSAVSASDITQGALTGDNVTTVIQAADGSLLYIYRSIAAHGGHLHCIRSTNRGLTWGTAVDVTSGGASVGGATVLPTGRIAVIGETGGMGYWCYSDDHGVSWTNTLSFPLGLVHDLICTTAGILIAAIELVGGPASGVGCISSGDYGSSWNWAAPVTVSDTTNTQQNPCLVQCADGSLLCAYETNEDAIGTYKIKCKKSTDGGSTWGTAIEISAGASVPSIVMDVDNSLYCFANVSGTLQFYRSTDAGVTWAAVLSANAYTPSSPSACIVGGNEIVIAFRAHDGADYHGFTIRRGIWEAYSSNACPCSKNALSQTLVCGITVAWMGGGGVAADTWTIEAAYQYAMENILSDSPGKPWRSTQDNIYCSIVIDMGANERCYVDSVALFGCNVPTLYIQMNDTDSWGSPAITEQVLLYLTTAGVIDSVYGNIIEDAALMARYQDHQLAGFYFRPLNGTDYGKAWKIKDNISSYIILDTTAAHSMAAGNTFGIFQDHVAMSFLTPGIYRYIRIYFDALQTPEGYYQLGTIVAGRLMTLLESHSYGFTEEHAYNIEMLKTPGGGLIPAGDGNRSRKWKLPWSRSTTSKDQMAAFLAAVRGRSIAMIPADGTVTDCVLVKQTGTLQTEGKHLGQWSMSATFEEVL